MKSLDRFRYELKAHLKVNFWIYFSIIIVMIVGLVLGIVLALSTNEYSKLLSSADNNLFEYINGTAELSSIFFTRLLHALIFMFIVFLTNITIYTSFVSVVLLGYQSLLLVLHCAAIISFYGISGVINTILLIIPINVINLIVIGFYCGACVSRARIAKRFRMRFHDSCRHVNFTFIGITSLLLTIIVCVLHSFVIPFIIKSFIIVNF